MHTVFSRREWACLKEGNKVLLELSIGRLCSFREGRLCSCCTAKSFQSCPTLCDPIDGSSPGSSVHGIFQARVVERGAIAFSVCSYQGITKGLQKKLDVIHRQWERKGILGVVTREMQAWQREKLDFCRIVRNLLPGIQGTLKIHDRQEQKGGLKEMVDRQNTR